jgi:hypothetical protein
LKIYTKGERVLRIEAMAHNVKELDCGRSLEKFPRIAGELKGILERFMQALSCIDQCFIVDDTLERLPEPSLVGKAKVGGLDFNKPRIRRVAEAVLALSWRPGGFTSSEPADQVARAKWRTCRQLQSSSSRLRSQEASWKADGGADRQDAALPRHSGWGEGHRCPNSASGEGHPASAGWRPGNPAIARVPEPNNTRSSL